MCPSNRLIVIFVLLWSAPREATALVETSTVVDGADAMLDVLVEDTRTLAAAIVDPSASSVVIDRQTLVRASREGRELSSLVDALAGARVVDLGGPVGARRLSLRGGGPSRTLVVLDGVLLGSPFATGFDVDLVPPETLERAEVLRGGAGATLGEGALSGALLLSTRRPTRGVAGSMALSYGAFETLRAVGSIVGEWFAGSLGVERTGGGFSYTSRLPNLPDRQETRDNADALRWSGSARSVTTVGDARLSLALGAGLRDAGVPGFETQEQRFSREGRRTAYAKIDVEHPLADGRVSFGFSAAHLGVDYANHDPSGFVDDHSRTRFLVMRVESAAVQPLPGGQLVRFLGGGATERSTSTEHGAPRRLRGQLALSDELAIGSAVVFGALRAEAIEGQTLALSPRLGARLELLDGVLLRLGLGRSIRAPAIDELYHPTEVGFSGNPSLRSEAALEAEASASLTFTGWPSLTASMFGRRLDDVILYLNRDAFVVRPENAGSARMLGAELELAHAHALGRVVASESFSFSRLFSRLETTHRPLPTEPPWGVALELALAVPGAFGLASIGIDGRLRALGPTTATLYTSASAPEIQGYARLDLGCTVEPSRVTSVSISVLNVLDARTLQSVFKVPLPGRGVFVSLRVAWPEGSDS